MPQRGVSNEYPQHMYVEIRKNIPGMSPILPFNKSSHCSSEHYFLEYAIYDSLKPGILGMKPSYYYS